MWSRVVTWSRTRRKIQQLAKPVILTTLLLHSEQKVLDDDISRITIFIAPNNSMATISLQDHREQAVIQMPNSCGDKVISYTDLIWP